jgi:hypothetical protein
MIDVRLSNIITLCRESDGGSGIWKRIDENRKMLQHFLPEIHRFSRSLGFIEIWLGNQDFFLNDIIRALGIRKPEIMLETFPRRWPGVEIPKDCYLFPLDVEYEAGYEYVRLSNVIFLCHDCDRRRGIWKRIDENRELLWFFKCHLLEILQKYPFFEEIIREQDIFLNSVANALQLEVPAWLPAWMREQNIFPRPWPD